MDKPRIIFYNRNYTKHRGSRILYGKTDAQEKKEGDVVSSCDTCYWEYNNQCVSESLSEIYEDATFRTCDCVGWLRKDFEQHFWSTYHEIEELIKKRKCKELEEILEFVKKQRDADCEIRDSNKVL